MSMKFYILSLKHTEADDNGITLWRADNAGYACFVNDAGLYENPLTDYHDDTRNIPVSETDVKRIMKFSHTDQKYFIPNTSKVWAALGVKSVNGRLKRLITSLT